MNLLATQIITTMLLTTPLDTQKAQVEPARILRQSTLNRNNTTIAGTTECNCDLDCYDGNPCTVDTCDENNTCQFSMIDALGLHCEDNDGDFCTIGECNSTGMCLPNMANPCDTMAGETCDEANDACIGNECTVDSDCNAEDDPNNCINGTCTNGYCTTNSTCTDGFACDGDGLCEEETDGRCCTDVDVCAATTLTSCDSGNGPWSGIWICDCPKYSSFNDNPGVEYHVLLTAGENDCAEFSRIGDDYAIDNGSFLELTQFRFFGGPTTAGTGNGVMVFEFWDDNATPPALVDTYTVAFTGACDESSDNPGDACANDSDCPNGSCDADAVIRGNFLWTITLPTPTIIPPTGYFAIRPGTGSGETVGIVSTNNVGMIGTNNPDELFWGEGNTGAFLSPNQPDILTFELLGNKIAPPTGSCCLDFDVCDDSASANTPWLCEALGGQFVEGSLCVDNPCAEAGCCFADGSCQVLDPQTCTGMGANPTFAGSNCFPNCCPQSFTASNSCGTATPTVLDTANNIGSIIVRLSGDNSGATNGLCSISGTPCRTYQQDGEDCPAGETCNVADEDECVISPNDQGHWESFTITANSHVEIGYCCTDPESDAAPGFRWIVMADDCDNCTTVFRDADGNPAPIGCSDGLPSDIYSSLIAGTYHYAVFSERYCQNSAGATDCVVDADCAEGTGPCITQTGPYELQITATALPPQACCNGSVCTEVDALSCEEGGNGFSLDHVPFCIPVNPCLVGACCLGAGVCDDNGGAGINQADCELNPQGQYVGGARCADDACPVCDIDHPANCQSDQIGPFILVNDRALWNPPHDIERWADDFVATSTTPLDRVCWWPAFFNPDAGAECSAANETPPDNWELTVYEDTNGVPGSVILPTQEIIPDARVSLGPTSRVWQYSAPVTAPPILMAGETYWIEINGEGEGDGGCTVYWVMNDVGAGGSGNQYFLNDSNSSWGHEDIITNLAGSGAADLAFCVSTGYSTPPLSLGGCCNEDLSCSEGVTAMSCQSSGGLFYEPGACSGFCPIACESEVCDVAVNLNGSGEACQGGLPCSRPFGTSGCPNDSFEFIPNCNVQAQDQAGTEIGAESWYELEIAEGEGGVCTVSACVDGTFNGAMAVYKDICPKSLADFWGEDGCGDDTCGIGGGMPTISFPCCEGSTYYIAMGGWQADRGEGVMEISTDFSGEPDICFTNAAPLADDRFDVTGTIKPCTTDEDCTAGETGPDAQTVCRDSTGDSLPNACYVAHQRYLSVKPNPANKDNSWTYRVSLDTGVAGSAVLGFSGQPTANNLNGPGGGPRDLVRIEDTPHYMDWTTLPSGYASIGDCEVSHGNTYIVQAIRQGDDILVEPNYSDPLILPTPEHWGDVTGGGNPGDPPNGATGSLVDAFSTIKGFQNTENEPKLWLDVNPSAGANPQPNMVVSLADTFDIIQAFQLNPYAGPAPLECP